MHTTKLPTHTKNMWNIGLFGGGAEQNLMHYSDSAYIRSQSLNMPHWVLSVAHLPPQKCPPALSLLSTGYVVPEDCA